MKSLIFSALLFFSVSAHAADCRVILQDGYDIEVADLLDPKGLMLVDESDTENAASVDYRLFNEFQIDRITGEVFQVMTLKRDLEILEIQIYPGSREARGKFLSFVSELPDCKELSIRN